MVSLEPSKPKASGSYVAKNREGQFLKYSDADVLKDCINSSEYFLTVLKTGYLRIDIDTLSEILLDEKIVNKLAIGIQYFQAPAQNSPARTELERGEFKWANATTITDNQKEFIKNLSRRIKLDERQTFNLIFLYFSKNPQLFTMLVSNEEEARHSNSLISQLNPTDPRFSELKQPQEQLDKFHEYLSEQITALYYTERLSMLLCIRELITFSQTESHPLRIPARNSLIKLKEKRLESNLWKSFFDYENKIRDKIHLETTETREKYSVQLVKEELLFMEIFFALYSPPDTYMSSEIFFRLLKHLNSTQFQGSVVQFYHRNSEMHINEYANEINTYSTDMVDLSVLLLIRSLFLNLPRENPELLGSLSNPLTSEITSYFKNLPIRSFNTPVLFAWFMVLIEQGSADETSIIQQLNPANSIVFLAEMKLRPLFSDPMIYPLKPMMYQTLQIWFSTICNQVQLKTLQCFPEIITFCDFLFEDRKNLEQFWTKDKEGNKGMRNLLKDLECQFPAKASFFFRFLTSAVGKGKYSFAENIVEYLDCISGYSTLLTKEEFQKIGFKEEVPEPGSRSEFQTGVITSDYFEGSYVSIPTGTRCTIIEQKPNDLLVVQFNIKYSAWEFLFDMISRSCTSAKLNFDEVHFANAFVILFEKLISGKPLMAQVIAALIQRGPGPEDQNGETIGSLMKVLILLHQCFQIAIVADTEESLEICEGVISCFSSIYNIVGKRSDFVKMIKEKDSLDKGTNYISREIAKKFMSSGVLKSGSTLITGLRMLIHSEKYNAKAKDMSLSEPSSGLEGSITRACLQLAISFLNDNLLLYYFSSESVTNFLVEYLQLIFDEILPSYENREPVTDIEKHIKTQYLITVLFETILEKFRASSNNLKIELDVCKQQPLMSMLIELLNRRRVTNILLYIIAMKMYGQEDSSELIVLNKFFKENMSVMSTETRRTFVLTVATALRCISIILSMVYQLRASKLLSDAGKSPGAVLDYSSELVVVSQFYDIFYGKEMYFFPVDSGKQVERIPINLILCFASYLTFEKNVDLRYDTVPIEDSEIHIYQKQKEGALKPKNAESILTPTKIPHSITEESTACLAKACLIWELIPQISRPALLSYIDYSKTSLLTFEDSLNSTLNCREKFKEAINLILMGYLQIPDTTAAALEFLILASYSQRTFFEYIVNPLNLSSITGDISLALKLDLISICSGFLQHCLLTRARTKEFTRIFGNWVMLWSSILEQDLIYDSLLTNINKSRRSDFISMIDLIYEYMKFFLNDIFKPRIELMYFKNEFPAMQQSNKKIDVLRKCNRTVEKDVLNYCHGLITIMSFVNLSVKLLMNTANNITIDQQNMLGAINMIMDSVSSIFIFIPQTTSLSSMYTAFNNIMSRLIEIHGLQSQVQAMKKFDLETTLINWVLFPVRAMIQSSTSQACSLSLPTYSALYSMADYGYGRSFCVDVRQLFQCSVIDITPLSMEQALEILWAGGQYNLQASINDAQTKCIIALNQAFIAICGKNLKNQEEFARLIKGNPLAQSIANYSAEIETFLTIEPRMHNVAKIFWECLKAPLLLVERSSAISRQVFDPMSMQKMEHLLICLGLCFNGLTQKHIYEKQKREIEKKEERKGKFREVMQINTIAVRIFEEAKKIFEIGVMKYFEVYKIESLNSPFHMFLLYLQTYLIESEVGLGNEVKESASELLGHVLISLHNSEAFQREKRITNQQLGPNYSYLIIANIEQILRITKKSSAIFAMQRCTPGGVSTINLLLSKLITPDCPNEDFLAIIKLLICIAEFPEGVQILHDEKIVSFITMIPKFKEPFTEYDSTNTLRSMTHIQFCYLLVLARTLFKSNITGIFKSALYFLQCHEKRILSALRFQGYVDSNYRQLIYSLAYLEELELSLSLVSLYFQQYEKWQYANQKQYEVFMQIILRNTVKIFAANVILTDSFAPRSEIEREWNTLGIREVSGGVLEEEVKGLQSSSGIQDSKVPQHDSSYNKIYSSVRFQRKEDYFQFSDTPGKTKRSISKSISDESDKYTRQYKPSMFYLKVEISLNKSLFSIFSALIPCLSFEAHNLYSLLFETMKEYSKEHGNRWTEDLLSFIDCIAFGVHTYEKCVSNWKMVKALLDCSNQIQQTIKVGEVLAGINQLFYVNLEDLMRIVETELEMAMYAIIIYLEANDVRNKQLSISFTEGKLKDRCENYLRRIFDKKSDLTKIEQQESGEIDMSKKENGTEFTEWLQRYFKSLFQQKINATSMSYLIKRKAVKGS